jgi:lysophospholipase L1-like esterase
MKKLAVFLALVPALAGAQFALHDGDRVVFYGDSITDQRLYTLFTEVFVRTRFPKLDVSFVHSGWGGDRVTGGGGGDIDTRLTRDVIAYRPTVATIMLGMNDAGYSAFDERRFQNFSKGYEHIVDRLRREAPGVRLTLIVPSPFDDVTRPPTFPGGYNGTLLRYGQFVIDLARRNRATVADLNAPVVAMLEQANSKDPALAQKIIPDRVHPGDAGHLTMAEDLLKAWKAPSVVSAVEIDAGRVARSENTKISALKAANGGLTWTQHDSALPFWIDLKSPEIRLVMDSSDFVSALNQQTMKVAGLSGRYTLSIDDKPIGAFSADELAAGVNLATLDTPMRAQAERVFWLTRSRAEAHNQRWRSIQTNWLLGTQPAAAKEKANAMAALDRYDAALDREAKRAAQPVPHRFALTPIQ